jgi:hypothetical protein
MASVFLCGFCFNKNLYRKNEELEMFKKSYLEIRILTILNIMGA